MKRAFCIEMPTVSTLQNFIPGSMNAWRDASAIRTIWIRLHMGWEWIRGVALTAVCQVWRAGHIVQLSSVMNRLVGFKKVTGKKKLDINVAGKEYSYEYTS